MLRQNNKTRSTRHALRWPSKQVENGMSQLVETDIEILRNEHGGFLVTKDFKAKFYKFIVDHYLRKFHCFLLHLTP